MPLNLWRPVGKTAPRQLGRSGKTSRREELSLVHLVCEVSDGLGGFRAENCVEKYEHQDDEEEYEEVFYNRAAGCTAPVNMSHRPGIS